jgi:hypothetical protein
MVNATIARASLVIVLLMSMGCGLPPVTQAPPSVVATDSAPHALPFKGRLASGDPHELPPAVAMSLSLTSPITFQYREELSHDDYHIPLYVTALDPVTYFGSPLGDYGVTAFASLTIIGPDGKVIGNYTRRAYVSKSYNLYSEPTHRELEQAARTAVRAKIDQSLCSDSDRLAQVLAVTPDVPPKDSSE